MNLHLISAQLVLRQLSLSRGLRSQLDEVRQQDVLEHDQPLLPHAHSRQICQVRSLFHFSLAKQVITIKHFDQLFEYFYSFGSILKTWLPFLMLCGIFVFLVLAFHMF